MMPWSCVNYCNLQNDKVNVMVASKNIGHILGMHGQTEQWVILWSYDGCVPASDL